MGKHGDATVIGVFGGEDPILGPLLKSLLLSVGYGVRSFGKEPIGEEAEGSLAECRLLLFAPGLGPAHKQAFLPGGAEDDFPALELVKSPEGTEVRAVGSSIWPAGLEELKQGIEAALLGTDPPSRKEERREAARR